MLSGTRTITAAELKIIADFFEVSMEALMENPVPDTKTDILEHFSLGTDSEEARSIPLNEQLFAAACELYPIYCCLTRKNEEFLKNGSLYTSASAGFEAERAFAAMVLAREAELIDRMELYGIDHQYIGLRDVVRLMDCFGLPYRAMVLRLYECGMLERNRAGVFLEREKDAEQFIEDSGLARRWMMDTGNYIDFGSLPALMKENRDRGNISEREYIAGKGELDRLRHMLLEAKQRKDINI